MKIFDVEGSLYRFLTRFWDMIKLNFLWLVFSLPIITCGAATVAAYSVTLKMVEEREGYVGHNFIKAFRENLKQGIPLGLISLIAVYAVYLDIQLFINAAEMNTLFLVMGIIGGFVFALSLIYAFPLSARYQNTLFKTIRNSLDISVRYFLRTLLLAAILAIEIILFLFNSTTMFFGLLIGPACLILTVSGFAINFFREIEKEPGAVR